jgi:hypothetical protein
MAVVRSVDSVNVTGLAELRREIKKAQQAGGPDGTQQLKDLNYQVSEFVIGKAKTAAGSVSSMASKAAQSMDASRSGVAARVNAGGAKYPYFGGAEFGAHRNRKRLIKNTGGRSTIVRKNESASKVIKKVESQTLAYDRYGASSTVRKRARKDYGATAVKVTGVRIGWNQFKDWRGNKSGAGYFLFPTVRRNIDEIIDIYGDGMQDILRDVFPD